MEIAVYHKSGIVVSCEPKGAIRPSKAGVHAGCSAVADGKQQLMGQPRAVRVNSGQPVDHSGPGVAVGPTAPVSAGRKPDAGPPTFRQRGGPVGTTACFGERPANRKLPVYRP